MLPKVDTANNIALRGTQSAADLKFLLNSSEGKKVQRALHDEAVKKFLEDLEIARLIQLYLEGVQQEQTQEEQKEAVVDNAVKHRVYENISSGAVDESALRKMLDNFLEQWVAICKDLKEREVLNELEIQSLGVVNAPATVEMVRDMVRTAPAKVLEVANFSDELLTALGLSQAQLVRENDEHEYPEAEATLVNASAPPLEDDMPVAIPVAEPILSGGGVSSLPRPVPGLKQGRQITQEEEKSLLTFQNYLVQKRKEQELSKLDAEIKRAQQSQSMLQEERAFYVQDLYRIVNYVNDAVDFRNQLLKIPEMRGVVETIDTQIQTSVNKARNIESQISYYDAAIEQEQQNEFAAKERRGSILSDRRVNSMYHQEIDALIKQLLSQAGITKAPFQSAERSASHMFGGSAPKLQDKENSYNSTHYSPLRTTLTLDPHRRRQ